MSVVVTDLSKSFPGGAVALEAVALEIPTGDVLTVVGPSGSGKTTLLRLIAGLEAPDRGTIRINGRDVTREPPWRRGVALVAQRPALFPHLDVAGNLALGLTLRRSVAARLGRWLRGGEPIPSWAEIDRRVREAAELVRLDGLLKRRPHELSGGEQQRVALGRAIVRGAAVWLLDEPLASLDLPFRAEFHCELPLLRQRLRATMVHVTHDPDEVLALGRLLAVFDRGRLCQSGTVAEVAGQPRHPFAAHLFGRPPRDWPGGLRRVGPDGAGAPDGGRAGSLG
jgi:ABC-type sugar transport system ATPase subunit